MDVCVDRSIVFVEWKMSGIFHGFILWLQIILFEACRARFDGRPKRNSAVQRGTANKGRCHITHVVSRLNNIHAKKEYYLRTR